MKGKNGSPLHTLNHHLECRDSFFLNIVILSKVKSALSLIHIRSAGPPISVISSGVKEANYWITSQDLRLETNVMMTGCLGWG